MELARTHDRVGAAPPAELAARRAVIWHDLECGGYDADLPLWRELAGARVGPEHVLEIGAGTGRVSLQLARDGHRVIALDHDAALLAALRERRGRLPVDTVHADARDFALERRQHRLCLVPMQTLQLLGGARGRRALFQRAREHLRPGGVLACAVITRLDCFDCAAEGLTPTPEIARVGDELYCSEVLAVRSGRRGTRIERQRTIAPSASASASKGRTSERYVVELDPVSAAALEREGRAAGLAPAPRREIPATEEHVGSVVVVFHA